MFTRLVRLIVFCLIREHFRTLSLVFLVMSRMRLEYKVFTIKTALERAMRFAPIDPVLRTHYCRKIISTLEKSKFLEKRTKEKFSDNLFTHYTNYTQNFYATRRTV